MVLLGSVVAAPVAGAATVSCGQVITQSMTVDNNLTCPNLGDFAAALTVQGNGIVLNLNGHTISGGPLETRTVSHDPPGEADPPVTYTVSFAETNSFGIRVLGSGNIVHGGTVTHFAAGVVVDGGSNNTVRAMTAVENIGPAGTVDFGDGIVLNNTNGSRAISNTVLRNGPFSGIVLLGASNNNLVSGNNVVDNYQPELCPNEDLVFNGELFCGPSSATRPAFSIVFQQTMGIKIEGEGPNGEGATNNRINGNNVTGSGNSGILSTSVCPGFGEPGVEECREPAFPNADNAIRSNRVVGNGFGYPQGPNARMFGGPTGGGSGILLFAVGPHPPIRHTIEGNVVDRNARHGISIGETSTNNTIRGNRASFNNAAAPGGAATFNGHDANPGCDANVWRGNVFGPIIGPPPNAPVNQPCVLGHP